MFFRKYEDIPAKLRKDVHYGRVVVDCRPQQEDPNITRLTVGGDRIKYPGDVSTPTAVVTIAKMVINSPISTPRARYMCSDLGIFIWESHWITTNTSASASKYYLNESLIHTTYLDSFTMATCIVKLNGACIDSHRRES